MHAQGRHAVPATIFDCQAALPRRTVRAAFRRNPRTAVTASPPSPPAPAAPPTIPAIFLVFFRIGLLSFGGGVTGWVYREVVVLRGWMSEDEFMSGLALAQILPGTNIANLAVYVGQRLRGLAGTTTAFAGLLSGPFVAVIALASGYGVVKQLPYADAAMDGIAAAAIGMLLLVALRGARRASKRLAGTVALAATFAGVGLLHWPLLLVVVIVGPLSVLAAWHGAAADAG